MPSIHIEHIIHMYYIQGETHITIHTTSIYIYIFIFPFKVGGFLVDEVVIAEAVAYLQVKWMSWYISLLRLVLIYDGLYKYIII